MRPTVFTLLVLSQLTWTAAALAQDGASTSTATVTPPAPSTTSTTQATVDVSPNATPSPTLSAHSVESGVSETTTFVNRPLLVTGLLLFGGTYAASAGVAAESTRPSDNPNLYYPVVGPWLDLAQRDCTGARPCAGETGNRTLLILDGVTQGVGALAVLTSFFLPEKKGRHWFVIGTEKLHTAPTAVGSGYGMVAAGRF